MRTLGVLIAVFGFSTMLFLGSPASATEGRDQCSAVFNGPSKSKARKTSSLFSRLSGWPKELQRMSDLGVLDRYWDSVDARQISKAIVNRRSRIATYMGPDFMIRMYVMRDPADPSRLRIEIPGLFLTEDGQHPAELGSRPKGLDTAFARALAGVLRGIDKELNGTKDVRSVLIAGTDIRNPMLIEGMKKAGFEPFHTFPEQVNLGLVLTVVQDAN